MQATLTIGSLIFISAFLGGGELLLRWLQPAALLTTRVYREHVYSDVYGWTPRPNLRGEWKNGKSFSINQRGYRGRALAKEPLAGARRVLVLGDSIAFGAGVNDLETFVERLQTPGSGFEVANLGVSGFGTDQELLRLERDGFPLRPDAVVLNVCLSNDYVDNMLDSYLHDDGTPKPYYVLDEDRLVLRDAHLKKSWVRRAGLQLEERSHLFSALLLLAAPARGAHDGAPVPPPGQWVSRQQDVLLNFTPAAHLLTRLLTRMAELCRAQGVHFIVLLHPDRGSYLGDARMVSPIESALVSSAGVRVVDLRRHYWSAGLRYELVAFDDIGHLTPAGHAFVAEVLRQELRQL
jgi:GDSL-like Lipase/Acylhydrolase family